VSFNKNSVPSANTNNKNAAMESSTVEKRQRNRQIATKIVSTTTTGNSNIFINIRMKSAPFPYALILGISRPFANCKDADTKKQGIADKL
jgi:hypothetical protein